jgi:Hydrophobic surface binding protein A
MKTSTIISAFAIASGALAQIQTFLDVISSIDTATAALDTAVKGYSGGDSAAIQSASKSLIDTVTAGIGKVKGAQMLVLNDALQLTAPTQGLSKTVTTAIDDLIAKKSQLVSSGQGASTAAQLNAQLTGANDLSAAISSKVPPDVAPIASQLSSSISEAIQKGVSAYADAGGPPSSGTSGTSGTSGGGADKPSAPSSSPSAPAAGGSGSKPASSSAAAAPSGTSASGGTRTNSTASATTSKPAAVSTGAASSINVPFLGAGFAVVAALFV